MKRFIQSEIGAAVLWVLGSLLLAAVISPWIYQQGKALAAAAEVNDYPGIVDWLAAACGRSKFSRFFDRSLLLSALLLLPVLLWRVRRIRAASGLPGGMSLTPLPWRTVAIQVFCGLMIAGGLFWLMVMLLQTTGVYFPEDSPPPMGKMISKILIPAMVAPLVEEWLFRGLLLGLWLRIAKPATACIGTSLIFSFVHFLKPPDGTVIADPASALAGFELLGSILLHFTNPEFFVTDFATLFVVGLILAGSRLRTGALWFAIGLHAGWIFAFKACNLMLDSRKDHVLYPWFIGDSPRAGLLPLLALGLTAWLCHIVLRNPRINPASR
jgi:uncharacterized protein